MTDIPADAVDRARQVTGWLINIITNALPASDTEIGNRIDFPAIRNTLEREFAAALAKANAVAAEAALASAYRQGQIHMRLRASQVILQAADGRSDVEHARAISDLEPEAIGD